MSISYDLFTEAFLSKITEYEFIQLNEENRTSIIDGFMKRAVSVFDKVCEYEFSANSDDAMREYTVDVPEDEVDELLDIISEGMVVQWLKPYTYKQENLENALNTRDYSLYSVGELLMRIGNEYTKAQNNYTQMVREYSYNHGDLTDLHL